MTRQQFLQEIVTFVPGEEVCNRCRVAPCTGVHNPICPLHQAAYATNQQAILKGLNHDQHH